MRQAKRLADALHAPWVALHVERAGNPLALRAAAGAGGAARRGRWTCRPGRTWSPSCWTRRGAHNATPHRAWAAARPVLWRRLSGRTLAAQLLRQAPGAGAARGAAGRPAPAAAEAGGAAGSGWPGSRRRWEWRRSPRQRRCWAAACPAGRWAWSTWPPSWLAASCAGLQVALMAAALGFLAWDFFFIPPLSTRSPSAAVHDMIALAVFAIVAPGPAAWPAGCGRRRGRPGAHRRPAPHRAFSRRLGEPAAEPELLAEIARQAAGSPGARVVLMAERRGPGDPRRRPRGGHDGRGAVGGCTLVRVARRASRARHGHPALRRWRFLPLRTVRGQLGVLGVRAGQDRHWTGRGCRPCRRWRTRRPWRWSGWRWRSQAARSARDGGDAEAAHGAAELPEPRPAHAADRDTRRGRNAARSRGTGWRRAAAGPAGQHRAGHRPHDQLPGQHHGPDPAGERRRSARAWRRRDWRS